MTQLSGFHIMLPPGWSRYRVDDEGRKQFTSRLAARMKEVANPELDVRMRMLAAGRWKELEQSGTHSIYLADRQVDGLAHLPISLAVRQHVAPAGVIFADGVQALTRAPVDSIDSAIGPILRWQGEKGGEGDTAGITTRTIGYGFAVPDADGRRGLVFTAAVPYPDGADPALIDGATELVDSIMETFQVAVTSGYALSLPATWIPIPTGFPWQSFDDPTAWATEVADSLLKGLDAPQEVRSGVREAAEALQTMPSPLPGALERFWRVEGIGGPTVVAHLYVTESDVDSAEGLMDMVRAGIGGRVQTWRVWTDTAFEHAIEAVIVAEIDGATVASVRQIGVRAGLVYLLDFLTEDPLLLEAVQSELQDIFRSIHFATGV